MPILSVHYVFLHFGTVTLPVLINTGASISMVNMELLKLISPNLSSKIVPSKIPYIKMVDVTTTPITGKIDLPFYLDHKYVAFEFLDLPKRLLWTILGLHFIEKFSCILDYNSQDFIKQILTIENAVGK